MPSATSSKRSSSQRAPLRRAELHERAGELARLAGRADSASAHFEQAVALFEDQHLPHPAALATAKLGLVTWTLAADIEHGLVEMERAFSVLAGDERDADLAMVAVQLARALYFSGRVDEAMERNELALEIAEELELPDVLSHGLNTKAVILRFARGRPQEATVLMRHALELALTHDRSEAALRAFNNLTSFLAEDDLREALEYTHRHEALARRVGDRGQVLRALYWRCGLSVGAGEWDEALAVAQSSDISWGALWATLIYAGRGELADARRLLAIAEQDLDRNEVQAVVAFHAVEAVMLLAEGKPAEALLSAEVALEGRSTVGLAQVGDALHSALEAAFELDDPVKGDELLTLIEQAPAGSLRAGLRAIGAHFGARRAALHQDSATAAAGFAAAARILQEAGATFARAEVLLVHAEWLAAEGRLDEAAPLASEAREVFERLRATPYVERLDRLPVAATTPAG